MKIAILLATLVACMHAKSPWGLDKLKDKKSRPRSRNLADNTGPKNYRSLYI